ncbi:MAG: tRNA (guanosine(46)-N7)-methyltransferase TrmB [bacterium]|nr:tRNA (guanosine(46)-N7)-methyltransferase TrmB [bacterium]
MIKDTLPQSHLSILNLPWGLDWASLFHRQAPLILEIGFGYGHFLDYLHQTRPDANIVGIEVDHHCLDKVERALIRKNFTNVRVVYAFANSAMRHLFAPNSLSEVHINFPDPWFKSRHAERRLMQRETLDSIVDRMQVGAKLYLATDIPEYAEMSADLLEATPALTNLLPSRWVNERPHPVVTKYERRAIEQGRICHHFIYERNNTPTPSYPLQEELSMPHIVVQTPLTIANLADQLVPDDLDNDELHIHFLSRYTNPKAILFEVFVHEPTLEQHIGVMVVQREESDEVTIKVNSIGSPRATRGVHRAVGLVGEALLRLSPTAIVLQDKIQRGQ